MLKLFRKIRQNLLEESKFRKYLVYALGEIILVVIGILIALQINTWNEGNKIRVAESEILVNLNQESSINRFGIEGCIDTFIHKGILTATKQKAFVKFRVLYKIKKSTA